MRLIEEAQCTCSCGARLGYTAEDVHFTEGNSYVVCPKCQTAIYISGEVEHICENCGICFIPESYIGENGVEYAKCPDCGSTEYISDGIDLDETNLCYPQHFFHFSGDSAKPISDQVTTEWARDCLSHLDKDCDFYFTGSGDTLCIAVKSDESMREATVYVCKKYSECNVTLPIEKF